MSVLIKGFEKPDHCLRCPIKGIDDECVLQGVEVCDEYEDWKQQMANCPLVPVPPHGDLIDRDALRQSIKESIDECHKWADEVEGGEMYARVSQALGTFVECSLRVKAAPTIIPAEEGE